MFQKAALYPACPYPQSLIDTNHHGLDLAPLFAPISWFRVPETGRRLFHAITDGCTLEYRSQHEVACSGPPLCQPLFHYLLLVRNCNIVFFFFLLLFRKEQLKSLAASEAASHPHAFSFFFFLFAFLKY